MCVCERSSVLLDTATFAPSWCVAYVCVCRCVCRCVYVCACVCECARKCVFQRDATYMHVHLSKRCHLHACTFVDEFFNTCKHACSCSASRLIVTHTHTRTYYHYSKKNLTGVFSSLFQNELSSPGSCSFAYSYHSYLISTCGC